MTIDNSYIYVKKNNTISFKDKNIFDLLNELIELNDYSVIIITSSPNQYFTVLIKSNKEFKLSKDNKHLYQLKQNLEEQKASFDKKDIINKEQLADYNNYTKQQNIQNHKLEELKTIIEQPVTIYKKTDLCIFCESINKIVRQSLDLDSLKMNGNNLTIQFNAGNAGQASIKFSVNQDNTVSILCTVNEEQYDTLAFDLKYGTYIMVKSQHFLNFKNLQYIQCQLNVDTRRLQFYRKLNIPDDLKIYPKAIQPFGIFLNNQINSREIKIKDDCTLIYLNYNNQQMQIFWNKDNEIQYFYPDLRLTWKIDFLNSEFKKLQTAENQEMLKNFTVGIFGFINVEKEFFEFLIKYISELKEIVSYTLNTLMDLDQKFIELKLIEDNTLIMCIEDNLEKLKEKNNENNNQYSLVNLMEKLDTLKIENELKKQKAIEEEQEMQRIKEEQERQNKKEKILRNKMIIGFSTVIICFLAIYYIKIKNKENLHNSDTFDNFN